MSKVLCIDWGEYGIRQTAEVFARLGYEPTVLSVPWDDLISHPDLGKMLTGYFAKEHPVFLFSHNFFPAVSDVCYAAGLPYLSLVFDSPHMPLTSRSVNHETNHIWLFDRQLMEHLVRQGVKRLHHTVLPADPAMARQVQVFQGQPYEHEISFLGRLYQHDYIFYDQINYLPGELKGYLDGIIAAQQSIFGYDMIGDPAVLPDSRIEEMRKYVSFTVGEDYRFDPELILKDMLRKKVSAVERTRVLGRLGKHFPVDLYTSPEDTAPEGVRNLGVADYATEMPRVFNRSKINLNLTLRTIRSGIPLRAMDILACGGFLLSTYQPELGEFFHIGEEIETATTVEEMIDKTAWYLSHDYEREKVAEAGQKAALTRFSSEIIFQKMIDELGVV